MRKIQIQLLLAAILVVVITVGVVALQRTKGLARPTNQAPIVVTSKDAGPQLTDPFLLLQAPLPESFESGERSTVDGWDNLNIVPVGNVEQLPTYPFTIDYRTRTSQQVDDIPSLLQTLFKQPFSADKTVAIVGQSVQQYKSTGPHEAYRAVLLTRKGQDVLIVAKAQDESMMSSYIAAYDAFVSGLQVQAE